MNGLFKSVSILLLSFILVFSFGLAAFAQQPNVDFIDVSHYNAQYGLSLAFYQTIKSSGVKGVVVKVSEGNFYVDPAASVNIANAKQAGMVVSAYHFARYTSNSAAIAEAQWFNRNLQLVGFNKNTDGYVVVDIEAASLSIIPAKLTEYTNSFINEMKNLGYTKMDIYSSSNFYNTRLIPHALILDRPWLASYPDNPVQGQPTANFSTGRGAWQWTSNYRFIGMAQYGQFDISEDFAGKYTNQVVSSSPGVGQIGTLSLVDYMKAKDMDSSFANRAQLALQYGIMNYSGTSAQNLALLSKLMSGLKPANVNIPTSTGFSQSFTYIVKRGDTLSGIAKKHNTTVGAMALLNHIRNVNFILTGQVLKIPGAGSMAGSSSTVYHLVRKGDTVSGIAMDFGSSISQIKAWNHLDNRYTIYIGKTIRVR